MAHKVVPPPGDAKENWQIIRAVSEFMGRSLHVDHFEELNLRMGQLMPFMIKKDYVEKSHSLLSELKEGI
jgi:predicted molibdopterin-dependent oxidoreductase YjgC